MPILLQLPLLPVWMGLKSWSSCCLSVVPNIQSRPCFSMSLIPHISPWTGAFPTERGLLHPRGVGPHSFSCCPRGRDMDISPASPIFVLGVEWWLRFPALQMFVCHGDLDWTFLGLTVHWPWSFCPRAARSSPPGDAALRFSSFLLSEHRAEGRVFWPPSSPCPSAASLGSHSDCLAALSLYLIFHLKTVIYKVIHS